MTGGPAVSPRVEAAAGIAIPLLAVAAAAGCLLPWGRYEVSSPVVHASTTLDAAHAIGWAACVGAVLALVGAAVRLGPPIRRLGRIDEAVMALGATLIVVGAAAWPTSLGARPIDLGTAAVSLGPGPFVSGAAGLLLLAAQTARVRARRGASPPPASAAAP